jgi:DNA-binding response OmpR family regulator
MSEPERPSHILLVDDEEAITANLAPFLERVGFKVSIASVRGFGKVWSSAPNVRSSLG